MGGRFGKNKYANMKGDTKVGSATECPMCGEVFSKSTSYNDVRTCIDWLLVGQQTYWRLYEEPRQGDATEEEPRHGK